MSPEAAKLGVIITGATGMVGEGVVFECLKNPAVERVLVVNPQALWRAASEVKGMHCAGFSRAGPIYERVVWARVKGRTENALARLPFRKVYNFRPAYMKSTSITRGSVGCIRYC